MATSGLKVLLDESQAINTYVYDKYGNVTRTYYLRYANHATSLATRHRKKPLVPTVTPLSYVHDHDNTQVFDGRKADGSGAIGGYKTVPVGPPYQTDTTSEDGAVARTRIQASLYNRHTSLGETLVEADQTFKMVRGALTRIDTILESLYRGKKKKIERAIRMPVSNKTYRRIVKARNAGKSATDGALAIQYGWMPIVQLLEDSVRIYADGLYTRGQELKLRSGMQRDNMHRPVSRESAEKPARARASIIARVHNPALANLNGLGLVNPLREAWNRVGLSFVFDWFIPVGTYLSAITAAAGLEFVYGSQTSVSKTVSYGTFNGKTDAIRYIQTRGQRSAILGFAMPSLSVLWTGSGLNSVSKTLSAALLFSQRVLLRNYVKPPLERGNYAPVGRPRPQGRPKR
uniref:Maturation protein n=1 Tax=Hubei levi-like virus 10 TaxID=1922909 RepID=A0A1L3KIK2_9VIRU|nr:hypothetical protein [Hubei levi-like virus 10]